MKTKILSLILVFALAFSMMAVLSSCGEEPAPACTHESDGQYVKLNDTQHLSTCKLCGESLKENHAWGEGVLSEKDGQIVTTYTCVCGATKTEAEDDAWTKEMKELYKGISWSNGQLIIQMNSNSQNGELESGCYNYLAGATETTTSADLIKKIRQRNTAAMANAKLASGIAGYGVPAVTEKDPLNTEGKTANYDTYANADSGVGILYKYWDKAWNAAHGAIDSDVLNGTTDQPDIYVNPIYDMVGASLKGDFQNAMRTDVPNYFGFMYENYDINENERGYMQKYVSTLGFSPKQQYLIASDYFIDVIRAFFVTVVNMNLEKRVVEVIGDVDGDGEKGTVDDLSLFVQQNKWTWSALSEMIDMVATVGDNNVWDDTGIVGLGIPSGSMLVAAGICYCNDVRILRRTVGADGEYVYTYNDDNKDFYDYAEMLKTYLAKNGVYSVQKDSTRADTERQHDAFATDHCLLSIELLGSIEQAIFQNMWNEGEGFFIAPMPMMEGGSYTTVIHNMGRVGAISAKSEKFSMASAFLNDVSVNSKAILESFYNNTISKGATLGSAANLPILRVLRDQIHFDDVTKAADDVMAILGKSGCTGNDRFHAMIRSSNYSQGNAIASKFETAIAAKKIALAQIQTQFLKLENPDQADIVPQQ